MKIGRDSYCDECRTRLIDMGYLWSDYYVDYKPFDVALGGEFGWDDEA